MRNYNLVIIENKQVIPFLNLTEQEFYDKLWEWTYEDDLWDYLDENTLTEEDLDEALFQFINDNVLHKYEDDEIDCFAFTSEIDIEEYKVSNQLYEFIKSKIKEHYDV